MTHNSTKKKNGSTKVKADRPIYESVDELAADIGISRRLAYEALGKGTIPNRRLGKRFIVSREAVRIWLASSGETIQELQSARRSA